MFFLLQVVDTFPRWTARLAPYGDSLRLRLPHPPAFVEHQISVRTIVGWPEVASVLSAVLSTAFLILTFFVLLRQKSIAARQADISDRQASISERQTLLLEESRRERFREAIGRFNRMAHDLASELSKADGIEDMGEDLGVDYGTHPRQILRNASQEFAPLGDRAVAWLNQLGLVLDSYLGGISSWNAENRSNRHIQQIAAIDTYRRTIGSLLDQVEGEIPQELRAFQYGKAHNFEELCMRWNSIS